MQSRFIAFARPFIVSIAVLFVTLVSGQADDLIDPLTGSEKRIVQAALALEGDYDGALDGAWGPRSARAFQTYLVRQGMGLDAREQTLRRLMTAYRTAYAADGWAWIEPQDTQSRFLAPKALFQNTTSTDGEVLLMVSADKAMRITRAVGTLQSAQNIHQSWRDRHAGADPAFTLDRRDLIVSSVTLPDRDRVYVRTDRAGDRYESVWFRAAPKDAGRLMLMASSVSTRRDVSVAPPQEGRLATIMGPDRPPRSPASDVAQRLLPAPVPPGGQVRPAYVNGVYINSSDLLTTASMLDLCERPVLPDGSTLFPIAISEKYDLAVLRGSAQQSVWLPLATRERTTLGTIVRAIGRDAELTEFMLQTIGEISAVSAGSLSIGDEDVLALAAPPEGYFAITSTVPEGSLGWPILTEAGALSGIVLLQPDAEKKAERISFAVSVGWLREFLDKRNVIYSSDEEAAPLLGGQVPATVTEAIVGIRCAAS
ncbi:hypothetical protein [Actibacterium sp. 188UL27-1]|uniref:hypothetical protein n=1 Tax=Actibacterium sp. 188UL27-1 TaxID=2786961 RepID=UPI001956F923|nr:hypothetical protein [Actibacterium sp. 188UL27-1]MBM7068133.1 hypothetical protein [Actibacterium sp. 188UL27-1]